jgi:hypothetical protein
VVMTARPTSTARPLRPSATAQASQHVPALSSHALPQLITGHLMRGPLPPGHTMPASITPTVGPPDRHRRVAVTPPVTTWLDHQLAPPPGRTPASLPA